MRQQRPRLAPLLGLLWLVLCPLAGSAQNSDTYTVSLMAGLGGAFEDDIDLDNFGWQAGFTMAIDNSARWGARLGQLELDSTVDARDSDLNYLTLFGEYLFNDNGFESGLYLGLGAYDLDAGQALEDETALGAVVGVTGEIDVNDRFSVLIELSGHYADLDVTQFFLIGHVGVGYHF